MCVWICFCMCVCCALNQNKVLEGEKDPCNEKWLNDAVTLSFIWCEHNDKSMGCTQRHALNRWTTKKNSFISRSSPFVVTHFNMFNKLSHYQINAIFVLVNWRYFDTLEIEKKKEMLKTLLSLRFSGWIMNKLTVVTNRFGYFQKFRVYFRRFSQ